MLSYAAYPITCLKTQELSPVVLSRAADSNLLNEEFNKEIESMKYIWYIIKEVFIFTISSSRPKSF